MADRYNGLTPEWDELLTLLEEECAELIVAIAKIKRHGFHSYDPTLPPDQRISNIDAMTKEMGDVRASMILLCELGLAHKLDIHKYADEKLASVGQWLHHVEVPLKFRRGL